MSVLLRLAAYLTTIAPEFVQGALIVWSSIRQEANLVNQLGMMSDRMQTSQAWNKVKQDANLVNQLGMMSDRMQTSQAWNKVKQDANLVISLQ